MEPNTQAAPQSQQPQQPASSGDPIRDLAVGFLNDIETNQDPDQMESHQSGESQEQQPEGEAETEGDEGQEAEKAIPDAPEVPMVEVELDDGTKVNVPENVKPHLMRDKDYRQKTMALADERKQFEQLTAKAQQLATQAQQMAPYHAQLFAMDNRANQLHQALQSPQLADDPIEFNKVQGELAILLRNRDNFANGLGQMQNQWNEQQTQLRIQRLQAEAPKFFEEVPDMQKPEVREALGRYVADAGLAPEEIQHMNYSVAATKLAWKAQQYDRIVKDQAASRAKLKESVKSLPPVAQSSRVPNNDAQNKQLRKEWQKGGGKMTDPAFDALLRNKLRGR